MKDEGIQPDRIAGLSVHDIFASRWGAPVMVPAHLKAFENQGITETGQEFFATMKVEAPSRGVVDPPDYGLILRITSIPQIRQNCLEEVQDWLRRATF
ncbi:MAG TPA: hypothetical protein VG146_07025 [Verrucomicrobiae bacterium]|nr:hypothetical protein [Verrucomicrobiae bacterium]